MASRPNVADLSPKQLAALQQLKQNVQDIMKPDWDDYHMLKWLGARGYDPKKAEKMMRDNQEWRQRVGADRLMNWEPPEVLKLYYPGGFCGTDKYGCPVWLDCLGAMDLKGMLYSISKKDILKYKAYHTEYMCQILGPEQTKKEGRLIDQSSIIFDMEHIGLKHLWKPAIDLFTEVMSMLEANYPETLRACYVVNAPTILPVLWKLAKPFLHEDTRRKIKIFGKNWKKQLSEDIDPDQLPVHWGGRRTDPDGDEYCKSKVCIGGKIPEKYRLKNIRENIDTSNFLECTVQRGSTVQLDYDVKLPGSSIRWQFLTEGNDIGFGIFRRTADERQKKADMEEVVKSERVNSHLVPEEGSVICDVTGTYVVRFDNTYSWVNAKKVSYLIDILAPLEDEEIQITML